MYESKHDFLYTLLKPIIKNQARKVGMMLCLCMYTLR